jgi:hypothetical protein
MFSVCSTYAADTVARGIADQLAPHDYAFGVDPARQLCWRERQRGLGLALGKEIQGLR